MYSQKRGAFRRFLKVERDAPVLVAVGSLNCLLKLCIGLHIDATHIH